jgi:DNA-binding NtrC family response regulator
MDHTKGLVMMLSLSYPQPLSLGTRKLRRIASGQGTGEGCGDLPLREARKAFERGYLMHQFKRFNGYITAMAKFIGMERCALHRKLTALGLR